MPWDGDAVLFWLVALLVSLGMVVFFVVAVVRGVRRGREAERRHEL